MISLYTHMSITPSPPLALCGCWLPRSATLPHWKMFFGVFPSLFLFYSRSPRSNKRVTLRRGGACPRSYPSPTNNLFTHHHPILTDLLPNL